MPYTDITFADLLTSTQMNQLMDNIDYVLNLRNRNVLINGDIVIDQRDSDTTPITVGGTSTYGPDRWQGTETVTGAGFTIERASATPPNGFDQYLRITSTANATAGAAELAHIGQSIEGNNIKHFGFGQAWAKQFTLSFWVRSSLPGTYVANLRNDGPNRSYNAEYTINVADTWEFKEITITADTGGTWLYDTGRGVQVKWDLGSGANFVGAAGSWLSANDFTTSNQVDWIGTASATFDLTGVQLELGNRATAFEHRNRAHEEMLCSRYYQRIQGGGAGNQLLGAGVAASSTVAYITLLYPTGGILRATPIINHSSPLSDFQYRDFGSGVIDSTLTFSSHNNYSVRAIIGMVGATFTGGQVVLLQKGSTGWLEFSAEL